MSTASLEGARDHARSQDGASAGTERTVPSSWAVDLPGGVAPCDVVWDETVGPGNYATAELRAGTVVRIVDTDGDACVHLVVHNARAPGERLNVADTVKVQWQAYLAAGAVLLSDMGRAMMTLTADTSGRHDALCGATSEPAAAARYGGTGLHTATPSVRQLLTVAGAKHDLAPRDLPTGVNLFKSASVGPDGSLRLDGAPAPGAAVELRAEMDVLVLLANVPHPLDDRPAYASSPARVTAWRGSRTTPDEGWWSSSPERRRAYENTDELLRRVDMTATAILDDVVDARAAWSGIVREGETMRIVDLAGNQAVDCLLYNAGDTAERYSAADTISAQRNVFLVTGTVLRSNEGRPMMTITDSTCARHDTIGGACSRESNSLRYGHHTRHQHACVENFLAAGSRHGLGKRDLVSNINWFMNVPVGPDGTLGIVDGISAPGLYVDVRAEMDVLVLISNCPQINNPCNGFDPTPIRIIVTAAG